MICDIINQSFDSFDTGIFPDDSLWKKAKVSPVYKADERKEADIILNIDRYNP